jgi:transaldolase
MTLILGVCWAADLVREIKAIYQNYGFKTQIITAAVRHPQHVLQAALIGSDVTTVAFEILEQLYHHPLTDVVMEMFLKDWARISVK